MSVTGSPFCAGVSLANCDTVQSISTGGFNHAEALLPAARDSGASDVVPGV